MLRAMIHRPGRCYAKKKDRDDPIATKYCFSARCVLHPNSMSTASIGLVFGYDKRPLVSKDVESVASIFCNETGYVCGDVEMLMHSECPVEVQNEIFVALFTDPTDEAPSVETMNDIAIRQRVHVTKPSILERRIDSKIQNGEYRDGNDSDDDGNESDDDGNSEPGSGGGGGDGGDDSGSGGGGGSLPKTPKPSGPEGGMALALP